MTGRGVPKKELDPEEQLKRKFRAKCLFRALGRLVIANAYWLIEGVDYYEGLDDVKRRVAQAVRGKARKTQRQFFSIKEKIPTDFCLMAGHVRFVRTKITSPVFEISTEPQLHYFVLTLMKEPCEKDKALLNKNAAERTDQEKKYIYRIIGGLKCFKRYPNHVKKRLAAATYFKYYGPGRVIVRQNQEAHAMYFIISGDLTVSQQIFDELIMQYVPVDIGVMQAGDMFGEVSLLHNIPRTATVTTNDHCELLALMKEDFKNILQASVQKQWDEVRRAMSAFTYFNGLDEVARREGCIVAKMKSYETNETLLGDGVGVPNFVYFMLSGRCQMIESVQVIVTTRLGKNYFTLHDPYVPKEESDQDLDTKYFEAYKNLNKERESDATTAVNQGESSSKVGSGMKSNLRSSVKQDSAQRVENGGKTERFSKGSVDFEIPEELNSEEILKPTNSNRESVRCSTELNAVMPIQNLRTYFMQVCQFNPGSSFGFGENMRDRRIVALTPVSCMLLPKIWLLQRNTANIWSRIRHFLEKKIPNKKQLFKEFVSSRRWQEFKESLVEEVISRSDTVNWTTAHDVPYSIRMEEMLDI